MTDKCFVCGRSHEDFRFLHDKARILLDAGVRRETNSLNTRERQYEEKYGKAIELLESIDPENRDLSPLTVKTDIAAFSKRIAGIEEILAECEKLPEYKDRFKFSELLEKANEGDGRLASQRKAVEAAKQKRDAYQERVMYVYPMRPSRCVRKCTRRPIGWESVFPICCEWAYGAI